MKISRNCLEGYLTPECPNCPDWSNGDEYGDGIGCHTSLHIMLCPYFKKVFEEDARNDKARKIEGRA